MATEEEVNEFLEHYGVPGMKWGVRKERRQLQKKMELEAWGPKSGRKAKRKENFKDLAEQNAKYQKRYDEAKKDPTFKREVSLTRKGKGLKGKNFEVVQTEKGELNTVHVKGDFKNSKGQKVSEDFANAVLQEASGKNSRRDKVTVAAITGASAVAGAAFAKRQNLSGVVVANIAAGSAAAGSSFASNLVKRPPMVQLDEG